MQDYKNDYEQAMAEVRRLRGIVRGYDHLLPRLEEEVIDSIRAFYKDKTEKNAAISCGLYENLVWLFSYFHDCSGEEWIEKIHKQADEIVIGRIKPKMLDGDIVSFQVGIEHVPKELRDSVMRVHTEDYLRDTYGMVIRYDLVNQKISVVTENKCSNNNIYYIRNNGDKEWYKVDISDKFIEKLKAQCRQELKMLKFREKQQEDER